MAYSVIATPVSGTTISTTAFGILVKDNFDAAFPLGVDGWTSYTPTLTQSATVTKTVNYAKYIRIGRTIICSVDLAVTGAGTAANGVVIGLPVAASSAHGRSLGTGSIFDTSAGTVYNGIADFFGATTTVQLWSTSTDSGNTLGAAVFTAALAAGDAVNIHVIYEAAS